MATSRRTWDDGVDGPLAREVAHVCVNGIAAYGDTSLRPQVSKILGVTLWVYGQAAGTKTLENLLEALFLKAIGQLTNAAERAAALENFGLRAGSSHGCSLVVRQTNAADQYSRSAGKEVSALTYRQAGKYERAIIVNIGRKIEELAQRGSTEELRISEQRPTEPYYVGRPGLEGSLSWAVKRSKIVQLIGEGGTGKTTLARQFVYTRSARPHPIVLPMDDERDLMIAIRQVLGEFRIGAESMADSAAVLKFRKLLGDTAGPDFVVIDNVNSWHDLRRILPTKLSTTVIVTSRWQVIPDQWAMSVTVGSLEPDEAESMFRKRLPDASAGEIAGLGRLHGRAIAIEHISAFLRRSSPEARTQFIEVIEENVSVALSSATSAPNASLAAIYREIISKLVGDAETAKSIELLRLVVAANVGSNIAVDFLKACFACRADSRSSRAVRELQFHSALGVLVQYRLVSYYSKLGRVPFPTTQLVIHDLTREILYGLFSHELADTRQIILSVVREELATINGSTDDLGEEYYLRYSESIAKIDSMLELQSELARQQLVEESTRSAWHLTRYGVSAADFASAETEGSFSEVMRYIETGKVLEIEKGKHYLLKLAYDFPEDFRRPDVDDEDANEDDGEWEEPEEVGRN